MSDAPNITVEENLAALNRTFQRYWVLNKRGLGAAMEHTARNFRVLLVKELKKIAPGPPQIEKQNLDRLKKRGGMQVSERAKRLVEKKYGLMQSPVTGTVFVVALGKTGKFLKRQNLLLESQSKKGGLGGGIQRLRVAQEIRLRKSHDMFLASSALFNGDMQVTTYSMTKGGFKLGMFKVEANENESSDEFRWGPSVGKYSAMANEGMKKPKGQAALNAALTKTRANMQIYIDRKLSEAERKGINN